MNPNTDLEQPDLEQLTDLEQLIEGEQYLIGNNWEESRFKGYFIEKVLIQQRGPYQRIIDDDEEEEEDYEYIFSGNKIRHYEGREILIPRRDYTIRQSQVNSGEVVVYLIKEKQRAVNAYFRNYLPKQGNTDLTTHTQGFLGGRKRMKSKVRRYKKSIKKTNMRNRRSKTRKTRK